MITGTTQLPPHPSPDTSRRIHTGNLPILLLFIGLIVLMLLSLTLGRYPVSVPEIAKIVLGSSLGMSRPYTDKAWVVIEIVRMPRILLVVLCGINLALAGATMQGVFRNPLVGPEVAGVAGGASFGGVLAIMFSWPAAAVVGLAFAFGMLALAGVFGLAKISGRGSMLALLLAGIIIGGFFSAMTGLVQYFADPQSQLPTITYWLLGSFTGASYAKVAIVSAVSLFAGTLLILLRWRINLLSLGEMDAYSLGINVEALRWTCVALVSLLVAAQVSVSGGVAFVGLILPHLARRIVGPEHSRLLPASALLGGAYLLAMDDIARTAATQEIPIGLLTSFVGTPVFAFLFWKMQGKGWNRE